MTCYLWNLQISFHSVKTSLLITVHHPCSKSAKARLSELEDKLTFRFKSCKINKFTIFRGSQIVSLSWLSCGWSILDELDFRALVSVERGKPENLEKNPWSKGRTINKLSPHMVSTRAALIGGERSYHCVIPISWVRIVRRSTPKFTNCCKRHKNTISLVRKDQLYVLQFQHTPTNSCIK